ncbi:MAG: ATP-binding protein [Nitrospirae bacterium]|nr:ATP-binding protein [Nitrospirota bacterium]
MIDRLIRPRLASSRRSTLILGPRQTGKSTLCRSLRPDLLLDLADEGEYLRYAKDPAALRRLVEGAPRARLVCVDEIQRVPSLLNVVQSIVDRQGGPRFLLTGSSARKLRRGQANLLPGRIILEHLDALSALEIGPEFRLDRALQVGTLPGVYLDEREGVDVLGSYAEVYLREEIRAEALTRQIGGYARFLDTAALTSGEWINYSKLASDAEIPKETIRRFFGILEDTLLIFRLPPFHPRLRKSRRLPQRDRFVFFDLGVRNALLGLHRESPGPDRFGPAFEQWMISQVACLNRALRKEWALSSYRTEGGAEVDLVIETEREIIGIEIKSGRTVRPPDLRGLASLAEAVGRYKPVARLVAYRGADTQVFDPSVQVLPYLSLFRELAERR